MFERFTDRSRHVLVVAQEEARAMNHDFIGTEHILLGVLAEPEGVGVKALESVGVTYANARELITKMIESGVKRPDATSLAFTPRSKRVLELALREALQLGHNYIGTEHIVLALVREGEGTAAQVIEELMGPMETPAPPSPLSVLRQKVIFFLSGALKPTAPAKAEPKEEAVVDAVALGRRLQRIEDLCIVHQHRLNKILELLELQ